MCKIKCSILNPFDLTSSVSSLGLPRFWKKKSTGEIEISKPINSSGCKHLRDPIFSNDFSVLLPSLFTIWIWPCCVLGCVSQYVDRKFLMPTHACISICKLVTVLSNTVAKIHVQCLRNSYASPWECRIKIDWTVLNIQCMYDISVLYLVSIEMIPTTAISNGSIWFFYDTFQQVFVIVPFHLNLNQ